MLRTGSCLILFILLFIYIFEEKRELPPAGLLSKCQQQLGQRPTRATSQGLTAGLIRPRSHHCCLPTVHVNRSWPLRPEVGKEPKPSHRRQNRQTLGPFTLLTCDGTPIRSTICKSAVGFLQGRGGASRDALNAGNKVHHRGLQDGIFC